MVQHCSHKRAGLLVDERTQMLLDSLESRPAKCQIGAQPVLASQAVRKESPVLDKCLPVRPESLDRSRLGTPVHGSGLPRLTSLKLVVVGDLRSPPSSSRHSSAWPKADPLP